ncbi:MAG: glycosyltransferase family 9 protein [Armatimonadetes bacterium]|nr:glycosyltransferase family 9 protein [Armatimonadota bacterium]MBS1710886.1 glycosyltransferase family 9 protein [Armatimonadota bacterium]MBX3108558.1 glycosyltransferase family 9 protein [Fimbriimonadaceae bacterium]
MALDARPVEECPPEGVDLKPKILVVRFSAMGDCVMAAWALTGLRNVLPQAHITWAAMDRFAPVIDRSRLVDDVVFADTAAWKRRRAAPTTWLAQFRTFAGLRKEGFDVGFDLQGQVKTALCLRLSGAKRRIATQTADGMARRLNPAFDCLSGSVHEVEAAHRLLSQWHECPIPAKPLMPPVHEMPNGQVVIQTGSGHPHKKLSQGRWHQVAKELLTLGFPVTAIGGPGDDPVYTEGVTNLVGQLSLEKSLNLVANCRIHISADTGTAHAASAYGVPVVTVFGRTDPNRYRPFGPQTTVIRPGPDPDAVTAGEIIRAAMPYLGGRPSASLLVD